MYIFKLATYDSENNVETGKMSIAVACRRSLIVLGQSADLYVLWYDNRPIVEPSLGHRDGGHLAGFYVNVIRLFC